MGSYGLLGSIVHCICPSRVSNLRPLQNRGVSSDSQIPPSPISGQDSNVGRFYFAFCGYPSQLRLWITTWALHFSSDVFIFILPLPVIHTLHLSWKKKLGLFVTFGFGVLSITACLLRFLIVVSTYPNVPMTTIELWCALDSYIGLMVACLPPLRPYLSLKQDDPQRVPSMDQRPQWSVCNRCSGSAYPLHGPLDAHHREEHLKMGERLEISNPRL